jgi:hypothetical protein
VFWLQEWHASYNISAGFDYPIELGKYAGRFVHMFQYGYAHNGVKSIVRPRYFLQRTEDVYVLTSFVLPSNVLVDQRTFYQMGDVSDAGSRI